MHKRRYINLQINCFVIHSHDDDHIKCKIKEEAMAPKIFIYFLLIYSGPSLTQTQILALKLSPNLL